MCTWTFWSAHDTIIVCVIIRELYLTSLSCSPPPGHSLSRWPYSCTQCATWWWWWWTVWTPQTHCSSEHIHCHLCWEWFTPHSLSPLFSLLTPSPLTPHSLSPLFSLLTLSPLTPHSLLTPSPSPLTPLHCFLPPPLPTGFCGLWSR